MMAFPSSYSFNLYLHFHIFSNAENRKQFAFQQALLKRFLCAVISATKGADNESKKPVLNIKMKITKI